MKQVMCEVFQDQRPFEMNVKCLSKGLYTLKIHTRSGVEIKKPVIS